MAVNRKPVPDMVYGKVPPQAPEAERAVLASVIRQAKEVVQDVVEILPSEEYFYKDGHQLVYKAILHLYNNGSVIDMLTVTEQLIKDGVTLVEGDNVAYYVTTLADWYVAASNTISHAYIVQERFIKRELIRISMKATSGGYDDTVDAKEALDKAESELYALGAIGAKKQFTRLGQHVDSVLRKIHDLRDRKVDMTGVSTGYKELNDFTGGWQQTDLIILAARPAVGKTAFTLNLALNCVKDEAYGGPVAIFNMEMGAGQLITRMLAIQGSVDGTKINRPGRMEEWEMKRVDEAGMALGRLPIYIDDTAGLNTAELRAKARRLKQKHDIRLIIIDYLQLMQDMTVKGANREQQISKISRDLKMLAKDLEIPIIALSQLNRDTEKYNKEPQLSDLRESGAIEQDADVVMFLYNPTKDEVGKNAFLAGKTLLTIKKHRNGGLDAFTFEFVKPFQQFKEAGGMFSSPQEPLPPPSGGLRPPTKQIPDTWFNKDSGEDDLPI